MPGGIFYFVLFLDPAGEKEEERAAHTHIYRLGWVTQLLKIGAEEREADLLAGALCKL